VRRRSCGAAFGRDEGSAVIDFVLVSMILIPLFAGILQLALDLYVRNTMAACAQDAARYAADADVVSLGSDAVQSAASSRATTCIDQALSRHFSAGTITGALTTLDDGQGGALPVVDVEIAAPAPAVGFLSWDAVTIRVSGHALQEQP